MFNLGILCENGQGGSPDFAEARNWYEKAATLKHPEAMTRLGVFYWDGKGMAKNLVEARKWFDQAAALNNPAAMMNLGLLYSTNGGEAGKDYLQARSWFEKAAALNHAGAMYQLGFLYENGQSVPRNRETALTWYRKAAERGDGEAKKALIRLGEQVAAGQAFYTASNWVSSSKRVPECLARAGEVVQNFSPTIAAGESVYAWFDGFTFIIRCTPQSVIFFAVVAPPDSTPERNKVAEGQFDRLLHSF
jgi:tetratricopeptide (TPR) repeat protein